MWIWIFYLYSTFKARQSQKTLETNSQNYGEAVKHYLSISKYEGDPGQQKSLLSFAVKRKYHEERLINNYLYLIWGTKAPGNYV